MAKNLGTVNYGDDKALLEIAGEINTEAVWIEAEKYFEENDRSSTEIRISGLDYVVVNMDE